MEDYEKKYKEALEKAKRFCALPTDKATMEEIFPELRESEDDRMINEIIHTVTGYHPTHSTKEINDMVAWLKKHKESLHVPETCEETAVSLTGEDEGIVNWLYDMLKLGLENAPKDCPDNPIAEKALAWLEKRKEQRSNEDDDPLNDGRFCKGFDTGREVQRILDEPSWSEEDDKMRYFVTEAVQYRYSDRELAKYLDPKIINEKNQLKKDLFDWLRGLRPSWKPSERQLTKLYCIAEGIPDDDDARVLKELYEQLKKL